MYLFPLSQNVFIYLFNIINYDEKQSYTYTKYEKTYRIPFTENINIQNL